MLKTLAILMRGSAAVAEEDLVDRNALLILDQQLREAAAAVEAGKRALALAMVHRDAEARCLARIEVALADLEGRAVAAIQGGRDDLATQAAAAILALDADCAAARGTLAAVQNEVETLRQTFNDATRRLAALQRGRSVVQAGEAIGRLRATGLRHGASAGSSLADAEATLARLRGRQARDQAADAAYAALAPACNTVNADVVAAKLGAEGFGTRLVPSLADVMARLKAKADAPAPAL